LLNTYGPSGVAALVINYDPDERKDAVEFVGRTQYTFVHLQADFKFETDFKKAAGAGLIDTVLLDRNGRAVYSVHPESMEALQRAQRVLQLLLARETEKK
jgi:hypothetical protein